MSKVPLRYFDKTLGSLIKSVVVRKIDKTFFYLPKVNYLYHNSFRKYGTSSFTLMS